MFFQILYKEEVSQYLAGKEHVSDGIGTEQFLFFILILCVVFFVLSIGMIAFMLIRRKRQIKKKAFENLLVDRYQAFLSGFLILPIDDAFLGIQKQNELSCRLESKDISEPRRRKLLSREIYALKKNLSGQQESQLSNYFFGLGLQTEVETMLNSYNWTEKVNAMQMIESFNISEFLPMVRKYVNDKNRELAIHAIGLIMSVEKSTDVLYDINQHLNNWECHKIVNVIKRLNLKTEHMDKLKMIIRAEDSFLHNLSIGLIERDPSFLTLQEN